MTENQMVERVARALAAHSWELGGNDHSKEPFVDRRWPHYTGQARAAIEAMRDPTPTMIRAAYLTYDSEGQGGVDPEQAEHAWRSMIDAALQPSA